ncbi:MAG: hypothetical protein AB7O56_06765 [Bauldia sp.]
MRKTTGLVAILLSTVAFTSAALAADPLPPPVVIAPTPPPAPVADLAGYVDAHFGVTWNYWEEFFEETVEADDQWRENALGGAGRAAWTINPNFALQLDAWFNLWQEKFDDGFSANGGHGGVGTHLVFGDADGVRFGLLTSVGRNTEGPWEAGEGTWANLAGEVAGTFGSFRVSAQGGYTFAVAGDARQDGERAVYVAANATFYPTDNLAITGHAGWSRWYETDGELDLERTLTLGARAEFQLGASPLSIYAGYAFDRARWVDGDDEGWTELQRSHTVYAGVRMLLGRDTLRALDDAVPFADYNPIYGDPFAHR